MRELGIQKVMKIRLYDITTGEKKAELTKLQESTFTNGQETVFLTNGDGTAAASFDHSKTASIGGSNTRISGDLLALQVGTDVETLTDTTEIDNVEVLTIASNATTTTFTATGTTDEEIGFAYVLDASGNTADVLTQAATASATEFAYDSGTKVITTSGLDDGVKISVTYYPTTSTAEKVTNLTSKVSATVKVVADCLMKDVCTDQLVAAKITADKGHVSGAFEWNLSEGGNPAMHDFKVDFLETCGDDANLWNLVVYDKNNMS